MLRKLIILVLLFSTQLAFGQGIEDRILNESANNPNEQEVQPGRDSTTIVSNGFFEIFYGKPGKAALYGLIVPGGGQIYNKKWWKLPLVYAAEGASIYWIITSTRLNKDFQDAYFYNLNNPDALELIDVEGVTDVNILLTNRNKWRKNKEYSWIFFLGTHLITIFESFIDRHLMEFDVSDDLSFTPMQSAIGPYPAFSYTFDLNKKKDIVFKDLMAD